MTPDPDIPASLEALPPKPVSPREALAGIALRRGLALKDVTGASRSKWHTKARVIVAREMRQMGYTLVQIGSAMMRDHTTVMYYLNGGSK